mmetsp:Transcript_21705/g.24224  ORF Transcript_21705/g.24224 Transcript_21705/m.24224 type:complete len:156 (+) Transcript_21705:24-491(+)
MSSVELPPELAYIIVENVMTVKLLKIVRTLNTLYSAIANKALLYKRKLVPMKGSVAKMGPLLRNWKVFTNFELRIDALYLTKMTTRKYPLMDIKKVQAVSPEKTNRPNVWCITHKVKDKEIVTYFYNQTKEERQEWMEHIRLGIWLCHLFPQESQ